MDRLCVADVGMGGEKRACSPALRMEVHGTTALNENNVCDVVCTIKHVEAGAVRPAWLIVSTSAES